MAEYIIQQAWKKGLVFLDTYERVVDGVNIKAYREESNDFTKISIVFPDSSPLPDDEEELTLSDYEYDIISIDGDMEVFWDIQKGIDEDKKSELMEELEEDDNAEGKWSHVKGSHEAFLQSGYKVVEKL